MDINANPFGINFDHAMDEVNQNVKKGQQWFKDETLRLEDLANQGTEDAKQRLLQMAQRYKADVNESMGINEIKNKIKAKLREIR